jgi:hypothetical protein
MTQAYGNVLTAMQGKTLFVVQENRMAGQKFTHDGSEEKMSFHDDAEQNVVSSALRFGRTNVFNGYKVFL